MSADTRRHPRRRADRGMRTQPCRACAGKAGLWRNPAASRGARAVLP